MSGTAKSKSEMTLIYWGKRGGGAKLFVDTAVQLLESEAFERLNFSARPNILNEIKSGTALNKSRNFEFKPIFPSFFALIPGVSKYYVKILLRKIPESKKSVYLIVMSSPWDAAMKLDLGINLYRVVHDANPHPGDYWPTKRAIFRFTVTSKVITLSEFVSKNLNGQSINSSLTGPIYESSFPKASSDYLLLIGRLKQYKNLEETIRLLKQATSRRIVVAGSGAGRFNQLGVETIDHWLSDDEFSSLLRNAFATICTYEEASQSGIVEESIRWQTPVIINNVGGLSEQVRIHQDGLMINNLSISEFERAIDEISKLNRTKIGLNRSNESLAQTAMKLT
jgi:glycosyltransferase involved in cell wall biosynthesis